MASAGLAVPQSRLAVDQCARSVGSRSSSSAQRAAIAVLDIAFGRCRSARSSAGFDASPDRRALRSLPRRAAQVIRYSSRAALAEPQRQRLDVARSAPSSPPPRRRRAGRRACGGPARCLGAALDRLEAGRDPGLGRKAASRVWAKPWMVWMRRPPGASSTRANRRRARSQRGRVDRPRRARTGRGASATSFSRTHAPAARRCGWPFRPRRPW